MEEFSTTSVKRPRTIAWSAHDSTRLIFGRLVLGWLQANLPATDVDLIVPNPTFTETGALGHTEKVLANARLEDV